MAGVIAHSRAIVSSANARVLVTLMSVLLSVTAVNKDITSDYNVSPLQTTTAVTAITALKLYRAITNFVVKPIEALGKRSISADALSLACTQGDAGTVSNSHTAFL